MKITTGPLAAIIAVVIVLLGIYTTAPDSDRETDSIESNVVSPGIEFDEGVIMVKLPESIQERAGIKTANPERVSHPRELTVSGHVVDIRPLIEFRSRYNGLDADNKVAQAELLASTAEYDRLRLLHQNAANISDRQFQSAKTRWLSDKARVEASEQAIENIRATASQEWGSEIVEMTINNSELFKKFASGDTVLLLVTLSAGQHLLPEIESITVRRSGDMAHRQQATYLSPAPYTQHLLQGETYYFYTRRGELRTGMHLEAWIPLTDTDAEGVVIPESAVIWYVDKAWVYVQKDKQTFSRLPLGKYMETGTEWFVEEGIGPEDRIVTAGSQMLLSEEFRWSIPDEDDNP